MATRSHTAPRGLGLSAADAQDVSTSARRYEDAAHYRAEISSVQGPRGLVDVLNEAAANRVPVHCVSQGSGIFMLDDDEIREMVQLGCRHGEERYVNLLGRQLPQVLTAGVWFYILPVIVVLAIAQRVYVRSLISSGVKG